MTGSFSIGESRGPIAVPGARIPLISARPMTRSSLVIPSSNGDPLVTIHPDGGVEFGDGYEPNEAAAAFWKGVRNLYDAQEKKLLGIPLTVRINQELARGEQAEKLLGEALAKYEDVVEGRIDGSAIGWLAATIRGFLAERSL